MKVFSERLAKLMNEEKISAYRLAKIVGVSNQCVLNWLDEINEPKISYLTKFPITLTLQPIIYSVEPTIK